MSATDFTAYTPATPTVDLERSHSAQISIDGDDVPDGTNRILIQAMEISDLTGNTWEEGYTYGYKWVDAHYVIYLLTPSFSIYSFSFHLLFSHYKALLSN